MRTRCPAAENAHGAGRLFSLSVSNQTDLLRGEAYAYDIDRLVSATGYTPSNTLARVERFAYDAVGNMTARSLSAPPPPTGAEGGAALVPNADDEAVQYKRHGVATLIGTIEPGAALSLPLAPGVAVGQDAAGNWVAPLVSLHPDTNAQVRVQLKAVKTGQPPDYRLVSFSVNRSQTALEYDADGALLNLPSGLALAYDAEGNLETVSSNGTAVTENWYDAAGRRIAKRESDVLTLYLWDGMEIIATADASGAIKEYYSRGPGIAGDVGSLLAETRFSGGTNSTVFLHNNHRGDVVLATDSAGAAVGRFEYSAFGMPLSATGTYAPRFGFSSKERDASGLVYYGFRFHSPELCRWITPDPIREDGGVNLYQFCGNDPVNEVDSDGLRRGDLIYYSRKPGSDFPYHVGYDLGNGDVLMYRPSLGKVGIWDNNKFLEETGYGVAGYVDTTGIISPTDFMKNVSSAQQALQKNNDTMCVDMPVAGFGDKWPSIKNSILKDYQSNSKPYTANTPQGPKDPFFFRRNSTFKQYWISQGLWRAQ